MQRSSVKRLLYSLVVVLVWLGFVVEGSHALLTASSTLAGNIITTGTVDLLLSNSQNSSSTTYATSRPGFTYTLFPGQGVDKYIILKNASDALVPLDIDVTATVAESGNELVNMLSLKFTPVDESGVVTGTPVTLRFDDLVLRPSSLAVTIPGGATQRFLITTTLNPGYTTQGQSIGYDLIFIGTQHTALA